MLVDEFSLFKNSSSKIFKSFQAKKRRSSDYCRDAHIVRNMTTRNHYAKINGNKTEEHNTLLSYKECNKFFQWFSNRMSRFSNADKSTAAKDIPIQYVVDEFMKSRIFSYRSDAFVFLQNIDIEGNGSIAMDKFFNRLCNITDREHISVMRAFIFLLEEVPADSVLTRQRGSPTSFNNPRPATANPRQFSSASEHDKRPQSRSKFPLIAQSRSNSPSQGPYAIASSSTLAVSSKQSNHHHQHHQHILRSATM